MPYGLGATEAGSSRAIPISPRRPVASWTSIRGSGSGYRSQQTISSSRPTRKTSIQARRRKHETLPTGPGQIMRVEHEYERCGAWGYLTAWDVRQAKIFGTCVKKTGIALFDEFVGEVMKEKPYRRARRV